MGLLPKGVKDFVVDEKGHFEVYLDHSCTAKFENEVHYERNVSGVLSYGQIGALSGISAQELFLWFPVKGIRVDIPSSGIIYFDVGVIYKQFSLSLFETPPDCKLLDPLGQTVELENNQLHVCACIRVQTSQWAHRGMRENFDLREWDDQISTERERKGWSGQSCNLRWVILDEREETNHEAHLNHSTVSCILAVSSGSHFTLFPLFQGNSMKLILIFPTFHSACSACSLAS
ncbi:hypothetical protein H6P81_013562 [Aristolochia fimbriata]|uniref:Uncharacterized protein n=1 Tax=Aristolochia fimbriata TaxID=158543 RepID=A0AAV7EFI9_ARIFI|nr:hypothetical protein H6P81_013562 [Aristolochia fimbriata]